MVIKPNLFYKYSYYFQITVSTVDRRKMQLVFKASVLEMGNDIVLLDFRLSRGDGLEFKRQFVKLKELLKNIEMEGPMTWLTYAMPMPN